jgi:3-deoxy-manno-octulosonate cytidylyltransferase (CMP-KDO synthetase)
MKKIAMIPARYAATRFPYKMMQPLGDKTVIRHTYDNTLATGLFDEVLVVTDSEIIFNEIVLHGGKALMSKKQHESGSDRIAEAVEGIETDIIMNVQGDEPFVNKETLRKLLEAFDEEGVQVASVMKLFTDASLVSNPNYVKVVTDKNSYALYFSRSVVPFSRDEQFIPAYYEHIGVYAFRKQALLNFTSWPATPMEKAEKLEQLRYLENGVPIKMVLTDEAGVKIDVPEDLARAEDFLRSFQRK